MSEENKVETLNVDDRSYKIEDLTNEAKGLVNEIADIDKILNAKQAQVIQLQNDIRRLNIARSVVFDDLTDHLSEIPSTKVKEQEVQEDEGEEESKAE